jgi:hypothetical protein
VQLGRLEAKLESQASCRPSGPGTAGPHQLGSGLMGVGGRFRRT